VTRVEIARAKVNLCLHVTGRQADGLHLLDSLVVFPDVGDVLRVAAAPALTLEIDGPFGAGLDTDDNLVLQAARLMSQRGATLHLQKNLPVAAGIGGGSADAAAAVRALSLLWGSDAPTLEQLAGLGADVPVCMQSVPVRMQGIGERISPLPPLPEFWLVLVNAGEVVNTGAVFAALENRNNAPLAPVPDGFADTDALFGYLGGQRNDMQAAAMAISPVIARVLDSLRATGSCALARMSGSGGTCFGLYATAGAAKAAAAEIARFHSGWWVVAAKS